MCFVSASETCKERLEVGVLIRNSNSSTQNRTPVLFHYNLTDQSLVQGRSLHDINSHHLSSRKRKEHVQTSDAKDADDDDSVASFSNPNDSTVHLVTLTFLFGHFAFTLFSNDIKCYAVNFVL